jgi:hypothetical protein
MKKLLTVMTALGALAITAPASAQYANVNAGGTAGISNRIAQLDTRFRAGVQSGAITRAEAQSLRPQLRQLRQLERQYSVNGLTQMERQDLQLRIRNLRQQLRMADNGSGDRYANWNDDYYSPNGNYGQGNYGQGNYGQGNYYGQGGPIEELREVRQVCAQRGGLGGILGSILGAGDNCLSVGERVSGNLYAVPYEYRNQFRDGYGYYHRSDGQNIYQIDARTHTVLRIYAMNR